MINFIRNYFTDAYYLLTFRQRVPVRVGTSTSVYLVCLVLKLAFLLADAWITRTSEPVGVLVTITAVLAMAFLWRKRAPGMFICFSIISVFTGLAGWAMNFLTHNGWLVILFNLVWFLVAMWRYPADLDDPRKQGDTACPSN